jgi:hypothetical protein
MATPCNTDRVITIAPSCLSAATSVASLAADYDLTFILNVAFCLLSGVTHKKGILSSVSILTNLKLGSDIKVSTGQSGEGLHLQLHCLFTFTFTSKHERWIFSVVRRPINLKLDTNIQSIEGLH